MANSIFFMGSKSLRFKEFKGFKVQRVQSSRGSKFKVQGSRFKVRGVQGSNVIM
jgi:hypothetical protein